MNEFFHNLSMQALNQLIDRIEIQVDAINKLNKSINNLLITAYIFRKQPEENLFGNFADYKTKNQKFQDDVVRNILYKFTVEYLQDTDHLTFPLHCQRNKKKQAAEELEQKNKLKLARNERDHEIMKGIVLDAKRFNYNTCRSRR